MKIEKPNIDGLLVFTPKCYQDDRGLFQETYQKQRYNEVGVIDDFVQDNHSRSKKNVLRGMHFQLNQPQAQIVTVLRGCIFDVCVDIRHESPSFGRWFGVNLSESSGARQIYMAPGFAHGFCVLSEWADLHYKVSRKYDQSDECGMYWNDNEVGIKWPIDNPIITDRDNNYPKFKELNLNRLNDKN